MRFSKPVKIEIEKFNERTNFGLWQIQVNDILILSGYTKKSNNDVNFIPIVETLEGV